LRMLDKILMKKIFGLKKEEVRGGRSKLHKEELNERYCSRILFGLEI